MGSQREHWTYRFGHTTPETHAFHMFLRLVFLLLALGSAFPYSAARGAGRRGASPQMICEHFTDLLGVQGQQLLVQSLADPFPRLLLLIRLKLVGLLKQDAHCPWAVHCSGAPQLGSAPNDHAPNRSRRARRQRRRCPAPMDKLARCAFRLCIIAFFASEFSQIDR